MPITKSAKKALRSSSRKREANLRLKENIAKATKNLKKFISSKKVKEAKEAFVLVQKSLDKAAKGGFIKMNEASRRKSRFSSAIKKIS